MKAIVEIDIPSDYIDDYKKWRFDGGLYYLEDGAWTHLKDIEGELKPTDKAIPVEWLKKFANERALNDGMDCYWHFWGEDLLQMIELWEKENENR